MKEFRQVKSNKETFTENSKTIITIVLLVLGIKWPLLGLIGIVLMWIWMKWKTWVKFLVSLPILLLSVIFWIALISTLKPTEQLKKAQVQQVNAIMVKHLHELIQAENDENWEDFIYQFHKNSPARTDASESRIKEIWKNQKTNVSIKSWTVISATDDGVIFEVLLLDKSDPNKTGTVSSNIEFRPEDNDWKIYTTSINQVTYDN